VVKYIPQYFQNKEISAICYSYKKPQRNLIFTCRKEVSAYNSFSSVNDCDCSNSKFCYKPHGHIITGTLDIVRHVELRKLLKNGRKYRISSDIDFDLCIKELADSLLKYSKQWCVRENVDANVLHPWLLKISQIKFGKCLPNFMIEKKTYFNSFLEKIEFLSLTSSTLLHTLANLIS